MAVPGLKSSIELLDDERGVRLLDAATGAALTLSEVEATMLRAWDGVTSASGLSDLVLLQGVSVEPRQVEQFFARLQRSGLLASTAPEVIPSVGAPAGEEQEEDLAPVLRGDLVITPSKTSRGTLDVKDPQRERSFTLYDFEVSIARMLDGRRTLGEVIVAANRLGIPATLATLRTFLQQLRAYQFIDETAGGDAETTWAPRKQWTVEVRELYQSALRQMRLGRFDEARSYVEAMAAADPDNAEAAALRQRIDAEALGSGELLVPFNDLHTPVSTAAVKLEGPDPTASPASPPTTPYGLAAAEPFKPISLQTTPYGSSPEWPAVPAAPAPLSAPIAPISLKTTPYGSAPEWPAVPAAAVPLTEPLVPVELEATADADAPLPLSEPAPQSSPHDALEPVSLELPRRRSRIALPKPMVPRTPASGAPVASLLSEPAPQEAATDDATAPAMWPDAEGQAPTSGDPFASFGFHSQPPSSESLPPMPSGLYKTVPEDAVPTVATPAHEAEPELALPKRRLWPVALVATLVLVVAAAVLLRPVPTTLTVPCALRVEVVGDAKAPREGVVRAADVKHGDIVEAGAVLARLEFSLDDAPAVFDERIAAVQREQARLPKPVPAKVKRARTAVKKAEAAVKTAEKGKARLTGAKLALAEKKVAAKQKLLDRALASLEAATHELRRAELEAKVKTLREEKAAASARRERSAIEAPVAGVVLLPADFPVTVSEGGAFAQLAAPQLRVVPEQPVPADVTSGELHIGPATSPLALQRKGDAVGVVLFKPELLDAKATLTVSSGTKPWVLTLK